MATREMLTTPQHRTAKGAKRIQELMDVASELFLERGFKAVAVDELIARVGGSRRNVYSHFGGKEGLFVAAMTQVCEEIAAPLEAIIIEQRDPRTALRSFGAQLLEVILEPRTMAVYRLMIEEGKQFPELAQIMFNAGPGKSIKALAEWIRVHQQGPHPAIGNHLSAEVLADQFIYLIVGSTHLRFLIGLDEPPLPAAKAEMIVDAAVTTFLDGVQSDEPNRQECPGER